MPAGACVLAGIFCVLIQQHTKQLPIKSGDVGLNNGKLYLDANGNTNEDAITVDSGNIKLKGGDITLNNGDVNLEDGELYAGDVVFDDAKVRAGSNYVPMSASRAVYDMRLGGPRDTVWKPECPPGSVERIFVAVDAAPTGSNISVGTTAGTVSGDITSYKTNAVSISAKRWRVNLEVYIRTGSPSPSTWYTLNNSSGSEWNGSLLAATKCT